MTWFWHTDLGVQGIAGRSNISSISMALTSRLFGIALGRGTCIIQVSLASRVVALQAGCLSADLVWSRLRVRVN